MKRLFWCICLVLGIAVGDVVAEPVSSLEYSLINNSKVEIGKLKLRQGTEGILINIKINPGSLEPGYHGMHFHEVADCSDAKTFQTAKGHVIFHGKPHGFLNPKGPHAGNLPNLIVGKDGGVEVELYSQLLSLKGEADGLLDSNGSSLIIHENIDDHLSQPIGGAGGRVACAEIK